MRVSERNIKVSLMWNMMRFAHTGCFEELSHNISTDTHVAINHNEANTKHGKRKIFIIRQTLERLLEFS